MERSISFKEIPTIFVSGFLIAHGILAHFLGQFLGAILKKPTLRCDSKVLIEAGQRGWDSVFFTELEFSLTEYLAAKNVERSVIEGDKSYLIQSITHLRTSRPSHFCYDPRSGSQNGFSALFEATVLTFFLGALGVTPIIILTDCSIRIWRYQALMLSGSSGVIVTFLDAASMGKLLPHRRVIGPSIMPISSKRLSFLEEQNETRSSNSENFRDIYFLGSLYPQRAEIINKLDLELKKRKSDAQFTIEEKSGEISADDYWKKIGLYSSLVTTTQQQRSSSYKMDRIDINQMVFRISEALAAKRLLYCTSVPGIEAFFLEGTHYIGFNSYLEAADKIENLIANPEIASLIAAQGGRRFRELINENFFWKEVDSKLHNKLIS
jgi:hypothetical protein